MMRLDEWPLPYVRVRCSRCDREGRLGYSKALDRFGPDRAMFKVREKLTEGSCERPDKKQPCLSILPDGPLVQAILAKSDDEVVDKSLIPEAKEWRQKLGMEER